jgi:hypothetical protein
MAHNFFKSASGMHCPCFSDSIHFSIISAPIHLTTTRYSWKQRGVYRRIKEVCAEREISRSWSCAERCETAQHHKICILARHHVITLEQELHGSRL